MSQALATIPQPNRPHQTFRVGYDMPARQFESGADVLAHSRAVYERMHPKVPPVCLAAPAQTKGVRNDEVRYPFVERLNKGRECDWRHPERKEIIDEVAAKFGVTVADIVGYGRGRAAVDARYETFHRLQVRLGYSSPMIGDVIGGRDHSTVVAGLRRRRERLEAAAS